MMKKNKIEIDQFTERLIWLFIVYMSLLSGLLIGYYSK